MRMRACLPIETSLRIEIEPGDLEPGTCLEDRMISPTYHYGRSNDTAFRVRRLSRKQEVEQSGSGIGWHELRDMEIQDP